MIRVFLIFDSAKLKNLIKTANPHYWGYARIVHKCVEKV
jgi:hypothetical protein